MVFPSLTTTDLKRFLNSSGSSTLIATIFSSFALLIHLKPTTANILAVIAVLDLLSLVQLIALLQVYVIIQIVCTSASSATNAT